MKFIAAFLIFPTQAFALGITITLDNSGKDCAVDFLHCVKTPHGGVTAQVTGRNKMPDILPRLNDENPLSEEKAVNAGFITLSLVRCTASSLASEQEALKTRLKELVK